MTPVELSRTVLRAVRRAVDEGELSVAVPERAVVTPPGPGGSGDYATNIALQLARSAGQPPLLVAEILQRHLARTDGVAEVAVTGPGFINIRLLDSAPVALVRQILREGMSYGHCDALAGQIIELRIPYDVRAEVVADVLTRVIASQGGRAEVDHREPVNLRPVPAPEDPAPLGPDAARWALLHPAPHDRPRITADHLVQRESNPLFRVRYAYARTRALSRNAAALGFTAEPGPTGHAASPDLAGHERSPAPVGQDAPLGLSGRNPTHARVDQNAPLGPSGRNPTHARVDQNAPHARVDQDAPHARVDRDAPHARLDQNASPAPVAEDAPSTLSGPPTSSLSAPPTSAPLLAALTDHPRILAVTAATRAPDRLARHLVAVADAALPLLSTVLPRGEEKPSATHRARLALAEAAGAVLAGGLSLLGIDAPEHL